MKRGRKPGGAAQAGPKSTLVKSTYLLEEVLKLNLKYFALATGVDQSDVVREAVATHLRQNGCDPTKPPKFNLRRS